MGNKDNGRWYKIGNFLHVLRYHKSTWRRFIISRSNKNNYVTVSYTKSDSAYLNKIYGCNNYVVLFSTETQIPKKLRSYMYHKLKPYKIGVGREHLYDISNEDLRTILVEIGLKPCVSYGLLTNGDLDIWK